MKKEIVQISKQCIKKRPPFWRAFFCAARLAAPIFLRFLMRQPFAGTLDADPLYIWCLRDAFVSGSAKTSP